MLNSLLLSGIGITITHSITFALDKAVYYFVSVVYEAFYWLADASILDSGMVQTFINRIYAILGVAMIFVLAYNLLLYIINPDMMQDKKSGATALIKDVLIALVVMAVLPMIFNKLYAFQSKVLQSGVISNLILGGYADDSEVEIGENLNGLSKTQFYIKNGANIMIANMFTTFFRPDDGIFTSLECINIDIQNGKIADNSQTDYNSDNLSTYIDYCKAYNSARTNGKLDMFGDLILNENYDYTFLLSTVAGVVLLFFMLSFCINLAIRVGKMALLELIAPIPLVLELIPKQKGARDRWISTLIGTYLEVFIYMTVMFFVIYLISLIPNAIVNLFSNAEGSSAFVKIIVLVILMFGLLQFGKQAPKMLCDLLGIKSLGTISAAAKRAVAMGGVTGNILGNIPGQAVRGFTGTDGSIGKKILGAATGTTSGVARQLWNSRNVHNLKDATKNRTNANSIIAQRRNFNNAHGGLIGGMSARHEINSENRRESRQEWLGTKADLSAATQNVQKYNKAAGYYKDYSSAANSTSVSSATNALNKAKAESNYMNGYNSWKTYNPAGSEKDYMAFLRSKNGTYSVTQNGKTTTYNLQNVIDKDDYLSNVKSSELEKNKDKMVSNAIEMMAYLKSNPGLVSEADLNHLTGFFAPDGITPLSTLTAENLDTELSGLKDKLQTNARIKGNEIAAQRIQEEARQSRNNTSGGGNNGGGSH